jgi:NADH-quinone oxidoreductase subunit E
MKKKLGKRVSSAKTGRALNTGSQGKGGSVGSESPSDPAVAKWFAEAKTEFSPSRSSTIPMLQSAQTALGYLPRDAIRAIARHLGSAPAVVEGVASFYAQFRFEKPGRHRITVCGGTACYVRGGGKLMDDLQADLKIAPGKTTADGAVTLESVACFGACALAPIVVLDGKVNGRVNSAALRALVGAAGKPVRTARRKKAGA